MLYRKNLPGWERVVRIVGGAAMIACGMIALRGLPLGIMIAVAGMITIMTGFVGICPACSLAGRKLINPGDQ